MNQGGRDETQSGDAVRSQAEVSGGSTLLRLRRGKG